MGRITAALLVSSLVVGCRFVGASPSAEPSDLASQSPTPASSSSPAVDYRPLTTQSPTPTEPTETFGLTLEEALEIARANVTDPDAELWSHAPGEVQIVVQNLFGLDGLPRRPPDGLDWQTFVWGVLFTGPTTMTTVYVDFWNGNVLLVEEADRPRELPARVANDIVFDPIVIQISNGTDLRLELLINGTAADQFAPSSSGEVDARRFGPYPWTVTANTESGRELLTFQVSPGDVWHTLGQLPTGGVGRGGRADLSCGRLDVWVGQRPMGPPPFGSFPPNDCDP